MRTTGAGLWLTWEKHRRTRELAHALNLELIELTGGDGLWRYPRLLALTVRCIARRRPSLVFVQCPSIVLGLAAALLKRAYGFTLVADLHNEAVEPFNYSGPLYRALLRRIWSGADICVVTNEPLKRRVEEAGATTCVLPDRVPGLVPGPRAGAPNRIAKVVFICTYAPDEPYLEVIEAARLLGPGVHVGITGDARRLPAPLALPPNVELTGFLSDEAYEQRLRDADVLVDLTRMEDCLVCGGYEAVALERPLVTSDTKALRAFFNRGTVYSRHEPASLAAAVSRALADRARLTAEMKTLKQELARSWSDRRHALQRCIELEAT
jgi:glycosyltransferase involved in cell wall biosynthesis